MPIYQHLRLISKSAHKTSFKLCKRKVYGGKRSNKIILKKEEGVGATIILRKHANSKVTFSFRTVVISAMEKSHIKKATIYWLLKKMNHYLTSNSVLPEMCLTWSKVLPCAHERRPNSFFVSGWTIN